MQLEFYAVCAIVVALFKKFHCNLFIIIIYDIVARRIAGPFFLLLELSLKEIMMMMIMMNMKVCIERKN